MINLENRQIILGSQSPRRSQLLSELGLKFEVVVRETDEVVDELLKPIAVVKAIATKKAEAFLNDFEGAVIITADTIVVTSDQKILGKPKSKAEAFHVLKMLSGDIHEVITAVCILEDEKLITFSESTEVEFYPLSDDEINFYIEKYEPFDKAGSYGIQEWIGRIGIKSIKGEYTNVVGLPTARLYQELKKLK
ncbi:MULTISPECIES: Maf family nucleotide pyrophosphatase [Sphingobacterium]|uniref:dTTP/UTP pyrophosphatase n=1 Tax=Sphingobacterium kitahiroshimense TaxID=470446 RepID=A0ABV0BX41_9SPHI|nr:MULTISPECIES: Maf family nucleotide pyrophosphatase [Sphingobacterium]MBB2952787.1 septum formation protein [Sphingobacterium sp. JUb56]MCS3555541.1 septum formation protein [Sphingobacterium sp. JUb21]MCW2261251.1 septum formation protein [Sphingobacterium kitahiroshimense]TCR02307.1 septum formation protein [Sphingobacterium sp. JUb20]TCR07726.1 septum formation protein [Sphingobacterium sp. JUb78]